MARHLLKEETGSSKRELRFGKNDEFSDAWETPKTDKEREAQRKASREIQEFYKNQYKDNRPNLNPSKSKDDK